MKTENWLESLPSTQDAVKAWTDGSAVADPVGRAGFAFVITFRDRRIERWGTHPKATVNAMEMSAIYAVLKTVRLTCHPLIIYSDSLYCVNALTQWIYTWERNGWTNSLGKKVKNRKLIQRTKFQLDRHRKIRHTCIYHIRGHRGIGENERADYLAGEARKKALSNYELDFEL